MKVDCTALTGAGACVTARNRRSRRVERRVHDAGHPTVQRLLDSKCRLQPHAPIERRLSRRHLGVEHLLHAAAAMPTSGPPRGSPLRSAAATDIA